MCNSIIEEFKLRRVNPVVNSGHHIVLVSEWDTLYGRSLPQGFEESAIESSSGFHKKEFKNRKSIKELCKAIKNDKYNLGLDSNENSVKWLNKILGVHDFYEKVCLTKKIFNPTEDEITRSITTKK